MASVRLNDKWGYVNTEGVEVIQPKYDRACDFYNGLAIVSLNSKKFYVDRKGQLYDYWTNQPIETSMAENKSRLDQIITENIRKYLL